MPRPAEPIVSAAAPSPDPRVGLKAGWWDAGQAAWNMNMVSTTPPTGKSLGATHSDLAFSGKYTIQGHYNGFDIYDISNPEKPVLAQQPQPAETEKAKPAAATKQKRKTSKRTRDQHQ